jgi:hypothetical protein
MKMCSYCGRENPDKAAVCLECGTEIALSAGSGPEPQQSDVADVLVVVRTFDSLEQASILAARLTPR